jgi:hypothetical protein
VSGGTNGQKSILGGTIPCQRTKTNRLRRWLATIIRIDLSTWISLGIFSKLLAYEVMIRWTNDFEILLKIWRRTPIP